MYLIYMSQLDRSHWQINDSVGEINLQFDSMTQQKVQEIDLKCNTQCRINYSK